MNKILFKSGICVLLNIIFLLPFIKLNDNTIDWYQTLCLNIFQPQNSYFSESFFFPFLINFIHGCSSLYDYKLSSLIIYFLSIYLFYYLLFSYYKSTLIVLLSILFNMIGPYFIWELGLIGFPDIMVANLIGSAFLLSSRHYKLSVLLLAVALMSHFSISICSALLLIIFSNVRRKNFYIFDSFVAVFIDSLLISFIIMKSWFYLFSYSFETRVDWVLNHNFSYFYNAFIDNKYHLYDFNGYFVLFLLTISLFLLKFKKFLLLVFIMVFALVVQFYTVDKIRIFCTILYPVMYLLPIYIFRLSLRLKYAFRKY